MTKLLHLPTGTIIQLLHNKNSHGIDDAYSCWDVHCDDRLCTRCIFFHGKNSGILSAHEFEILP